MQTTTMHQRLAAVRERSSRSAVAVPVAFTLDEQIIAILLEPVRSEETAREGFDRKEREVGTFFAQLAPVDALKLARRLDRASPSDPLIVALQRLTADRRARLISFLADSRRRAALR